MNKMTKTLSSTRGVIAAAASMLACAALVLALVPLQAIAAQINTPVGAYGLVYDGTDQVLVSGGGKDSKYELSVAEDSGAEIDKDGNAIAKNVGDYTITVTLKNTTEDSWYPTDNTDPYQLKVSIATSNLNKSSIKVDMLEYVTYDGKAQTPAVTVMDGKVKLVEGEDYTLEYTNNTDVGTAKVYIHGTGNYTGTLDRSFTITTDQAMYRLYNPNSGEHFYTANAAERANLISVGWNDEKIGWYSPVKSSTPVYRLYNANGGEHHYTTNAAERDMLKAAGWNDEGIGWYSDDAQTVKVLREYNPNQFSCNHNYTTSQGEHDYLVSIGWKDEGIGWYATAMAK